MGWDVTNTPERLEIRADDGAGPVIIAVPRRRPGEIALSIDVDATRGPESRLGWNGQTNHGQVISTNLCTTSGFMTEFATVWVYPTNAVLPDVTADDFRLEDTHPVVLVEHLTDGNLRITVDRDTDGTHDTQVTSVFALVAPERSPFCAGHHPVVPAVDR